MPAKPVVPGVYTIALGMVNTFLIDADGLTLVDTGSPGDADKILQAIRSLGKNPEDLRHILVTHYHPDHVGSLAVLKQRTGATAFMHPDGAQHVRKGLIPFKLQPGPGLLNRLLFRLFIRTSGEARIAAAAIEHEIGDGDVLPVAGGIKALTLPGHCCGHLAFIWPQHGDVVFAGDVAANIVRLDYSICYEDLAEGKRSLAKLAGLNFEVACFGHGKAIVGGAASRFRQKWGTPALQSRSKGEG